MILLTSLIAAAYCFTIGAFLRGIYKTQPFLNAVQSSEKSYSILIALRNESENLQALFKSIKTLDYPADKFELIFIDDHSEDSSLQLLYKFKKENSSSQIDILNNDGTGKKTAISKGIEAAKYNCILTTDADCILPKKWIQTYDALLQKEDYAYISGPVKLKQNPTFLSQFQNIEFFSLQGSTMGSFAIGKPFMSNAANSYYSKETFIKQKGFSGNEVIASGDDVFLLEKISAQQPKKVAFLNSQAAIVITNSETTWKALIHQKVRWAAKASSYKNKTGIFVGSTVFFANLWLLILALLSPKLAILFFVLKLILDFLILEKTAKFYSQRMPLYPFLLSSLLYPFFSVFIFILSQFISFEWKGRRLKK